MNVIDVSKLKITGRLNAKVFLSLVTLSNESLNKRTRDRRTKNRSDHADFKNEKIHLPVLTHNRY